jgi:beta-galactosidase
MKLKRPGVHRLTVLQAVAHGSDTVQYFQWRQSRGCSEKFHGAVVSHSGGADTRVFGDVAEVGEILAALDDVVGTTVRPEVALIYDWQNNWAIEGAAGPRREGRDYLRTCQAHYRRFWSRAVPVDVIRMTADLGPYRLVVAPMLYMLRQGVAEQLEEFVRGGGVLVTTYWTGIADENDLCFQGGFPGPLRECLGISSEELDVLYDDESVRVVPAEGNPLGLEGEYEARIFCDLIHPESARAIATYGSEFYAGGAALTVNAFGDGRAYYVAFRGDDRFLDDFHGALARELGLRRVLNADLPEGMTAQLRTDGEREFVFLLNFRREERRVDLGAESFLDVLTGERAEGEIMVLGYGSLVLERL